MGSKAWKHQEWSWMWAGLCCSQINSHIQLKEVIHTSYHSYSRTAIFKIPPYFGFCTILTLYSLHYSITVCCKTVGVSLLTFRKSTSGPENHLYYCYHLIVLVQQLEMHVLERRNYSCFRHQCSYNSWLCGASMRPEHLNYKALSTHIEVSES